MATTIIVDVAAVLKQDPSLKKCLLEEVTLGVLEFFGVFVGALDCRLSLGDATGDVSDMEEEKEDGDFENELDADERRDGVDDEEE